MSVKYYDSERAASEYLFLHYGKTEPRLPAGLAESGALDFPARCVKACLDPASLPENSRALDLGCAVGRSSFELARHCVEVVGIDSSRQFVTIARHLRDNGPFTFSYCDEGDLTQSHRAIVPKDNAREAASAPGIRVQVAGQLHMDRTTVLNMEAGRTLAINRFVTLFNHMGYDLIAVPRGAIVRVRPPDVDEGTP